MTLHEASNYNEIAAVLRGISPAEFQLLGATVVAYAKPIRTEDGTQAYAIHAGDGTPLAMVDDLAIAIDLLADRDMTLLPVH